MNLEKPLWQLCFEKKNCWEKLKLWAEMHRSLIIQPHFRRNWPRLQDMRPRQPVGNEMQASVHPARSQKPQLLQGSPFSSSHKSIPSPGCGPDTWLLSPRAVLHFPIRIYKGRLPIYKGRFCPSESTRVTPRNRADNANSLGQRSENSSGKTDPKEVSTAEGPCATVCPGPSQFTPTS